MRSSQQWLLLALVSLASSACVRTTDPLPLGARSADCASCHVEQAADFARSPHARSDRSPVLEALVPHAREAWGEAAADRCQRCHAPSHAALLGDLDAERSVTCVTCHAAIGNRGEHDGLLLVDPSAPLAGPFGDAEATPAHASRGAPLLGSSALCGTCHEVTGLVILHISKSPTNAGILRRPRDAGVGGPGRVPQAEGRGCLSIGTPSPAARFEAGEI